MVLIHEVAQRLRLTWWGLVLLGCAFALIEEGLALQTIFNPVGMDGEAVHGRALGVNWFWAVVVSGYHIVWSVLLPIAIVHLVFPRCSRVPWLSRRAATVLILLFASGTAVFLLISYLRSDFRLSWVQAAATMVVVAGLVWAATKCKEHGSVALTGSVPRRNVVGLFGFAAGAGWFVLFLVAFIGGPISFIWWTAGALLYSAGTALLVRRWTRRAWTARHQLALCFGLAMASALFGLLLVALSEHRADIAFQCAVITALIVGNAWIRRRANASPATPPYRPPERQSRESR
ncbi:hypothetical protein [Nocardia sp. XZ_19_385]|uniref:hypothetical protein n=1 Tax=Nocardia sp. XZ_19_385 TaxID=2769488 RepID=UPI0018907138|nr:hypothetical protein [Nocardia sp. XZ_19_385]